MCIRDSHRRTCSNQRSEQRDPGTNDQSTQLVSAELVCAKEVRAPSRRLVRVNKILSVRAERYKVPPDNGADYDDDQPRERDQTPVRAMLPSGTRHPSCPIVGSPYRVVNFNLSLIHI